MKLFDSIAHAFIMTFGITPPRPEHRRIATLFINVTLLLTVLGVLALFIFAISSLLIH